MAEDDPGGRAPRGPGPRKGSLFGTALVLVLLLVGCYRGGTLPPTPFLDLAPPPELTLQPIIIDGSALMQPLVAELGRAFQQMVPRATVLVSDSGTRTGFGQFCTGELLLLDALRPIDEAESALCEVNGVAWQAVALAYDAAAVVIPADNPFAECLNLTQLNSIWRAGSVVQNWRQINLQYEDRLLAVYAPPADSLAYNLFQMQVLAGSALRQPLYEGPPVGPDAIGFLPLEQALQWSPAVRLLPLAAGEGELSGMGAECVAPAEETVLAGTYPLARPLLLYVNTLSLIRPEVAQFVRFMLGPDADPVMRGLYLVPPSVESRAHALEQLGLPR